MNNPLPSGNKDREIYERSKEITINFIDRLNEKGIMRKWITPEEHALVERVMDRINLEGESLTKLEQIITSTKLPKFEEVLNQFEILERDIMNYYAGLLIQQILDIFELFKKFLFASIDKDKASLTGKEALGTLLLRLKQKKIHLEFDEFLDLDLRNALGHGWHWFENNKFHYVVDPELKRTKIISLADLFIKMRQIALLNRAFADHAFARMAEIVQNNIQNESRLDTNKKANGEPRI